MNIVAPQPQGAIFIDSKKSGVTTKKNVNNFFVEKEGKTTHTLHVSQKFGVPRSRSESISRLLTRALNGDYIARRAEGIDSRPFQFLVSWATAAHLSISL